jgi:hypothetical protein
VGKEAKQVTVAYTPSATGERFHASSAFIRGIMGPVGSGKSVACCMELWGLMSTQEPDENGVRYSRWGVVRNTYPELLSTTLKTWLAWFPEGVFGKVKRNAPIVHEIRLRLPDGTVVHSDVEFFALDKEADAKKVLSYECSGIWVNEARELPFSLISNMTMRPGRYPSAKEGGMPCTRKALIMDTNPPTEQHWWYNLAENETPEDWEFFRQPGGREPNAENLENLEQTKESLNWPLEKRRELGRKYYNPAGKTPDFVRVMIDGNYGYLDAGLPVFGRVWNRDVHLAKEPLLVNPHARLYLGVDCSGRHPAAVWVQRVPGGQIQVVHELAVREREGMGAERFSRLLVEEHRRVFGFKAIDEVWGDPAGNSPSQNNERTYFDLLNVELRALGLKMRASRGFRISQRLKPMEAVLSRLVDGQPAFKVSPACKWVVEAFEGGYKFKERKTADGLVTEDEPVKNRASDIMDAAMYVVCELEDMTIRAIKRPNRKVQVATWRVG